jgi:hypothetical protein
MRRITGLVAASVLFLAACGGDDDDNAGSAQSETATATADANGGSASGVQNDAANEIIDQADTANLDPDEGCIRDKAANLSDEDAQKIVDAGSSDTPDLSPAGLAIVAETMSCVSESAMLDQIIESLPEGVDGDCVRDKLKDLDFGAIFESGTTPPEVDQAKSECGTG